MSELGRRVAVAVVGIPVTVGAVYAGNGVLAFFLGIVAGAGAWEVYRLARAAGHDPFDRIGIVLAACVPLLAEASMGGVFSTSAAAVATVLLAVLGVAIWTRGVGGHPLETVAITIFGAAYPACITFGYVLRHYPYTIGATGGSVLVLLPVAVTWSNDTAAFVVGRLLGRHKLIPAVSPGKSVEGTIGGALAAVGVTWVYVHAFLMPLSHLSLRPLHIVAFGVAVSVAALVGDLAESLLKREAGVKDSSGLLPGHGGILDRIDSLLFVLPVSVLILGVTLLPVPT